MLYEMKIFKSNLQICEGKLSYMEEISPCLLTLHDNDMWVKYKTDVTITCKAVTYQLLFTLHRWFAHGELALRHLF